MWRVSTLTADEPLHNPYYGSHRRQVRSSIFNSSEMTINWSEIYTLEYLNPFDVMSVSYAFGVNRP